MPATLDQIADPFTVFGVACFADNQFLGVGFNKSGAIFCKVVQQPVHLRGCSFNVLAPVLRCALI